MDLVPWMDIKATPSLVQPRHNDFPWWEVAPRWNAGELPRHQSRMLPPQPRSTRRATLAQSRPLLIGMDGHKDTMAVAYIAPDQGAAVPSLGTSGTRPCESDPLMRKMPSTAQPRIWVYAAGPCGSWL